MERNFAEDNGVSRCWADGPLVAFSKIIASPRVIVSRTHDVNYLALSGGGSGGAFSAGVLNGWTDRGGRPDFDVVSGVSTGALIAPLAFLGSSYDAILKASYTNTGDGENMVRLQNPLKILNSGGLFDPRPLRALVERYADAEMLARVAAEYRKGRRLLVVTTNLDAQRPVVWDLSAIAASDRSDALALFRNVLVASASVPAVYPPVMIQMSAPGQGPAEMHVDGAVTDQVFIAPELFRASASNHGGFAKVHIWVIVNNTLPPEYAVTSTSATSIGARTLATLAKSQTYWILKAAQERAHRMGIDFNLAYIGDHVEYDGSKPFAADYMRQVYDIGYADVFAGTLWRKALAPWTHPATAKVTTGSPS